MVPRQSVGWGDAWRTMRLNSRRSSSTEPTFVRSQNISVVGSRPGNRQSHMKTERSNARAVVLWPMSCGQTAEVFRFGRHVRFGPRARGTATSAIQAADIRNKKPHDEGFYKARDATQQPQKLILATRSQLENFQSFCIPGTRRCGLHDRVQQARCKPTAWACHTWCTEEFRSPRGCTMDFVG